IRDEGLPCDVFGLEPGWQSHAYSCSYRWNEQNFPDPDVVVAKLAKKNFRINLWEHIFVNSASDIYEDLVPYSGDYLVWNGLVPDYSLPEAVDIYSAHHKKEFADKGISGFKIDECDNSDFIYTPWSFPEVSEFPSGLDGEQMHCLLGTLYMHANMAPFIESGRRTYGCVRSAGALAASIPYVLYSDLYDHRDYIRGMVNMGYSGLLWTPEVRQCDSAEDLIRRIQSVILSPMAMLNAWMIPNPPWMQFDMNLNKAGVFLDDWKEVTARCRELFRLRMSFLPYLYAVFYQYNHTGRPPFSALPLHFPNDPETYKIDDSYMIGDSLLFAPLFAGESGRRVYLPGDEWYNYFTGEKFAPGWHELEASVDEMLLFVRKNSVIPVAEPVDHVDEKTVFSITLKRFGQEGSCILAEDDFESFDYQKGVQNIWHITWAGSDRPVIEKSEHYSGNKYSIDGFVSVS
ncbi:MAG: TIM-barrel domain-containing protein, partial [Acutalibacteraceae bacterium]